MLIHREDRSGYVVYINPRTGIKARIWGDDLATIGFTCQDWYSGQWTACYRMFSGGDYSADTLREVLHELEAASVPPSSLETHDVYFELLDAIEMLQQIVTQLDAIDDEDLDGLGCICGLDAANALYIKYSPVNQAYFVMWHDTVLRIFNDERDANNYVRELRNGSVTY